MTRMPIVRFPARAGEGMFPRAAVAAAVGAHLLLIGVGFWSRHDTLLDLIRQGETVAVTKADPVSETTVEWVFLDEVAPPPPTPDPTFVVPREEVPPPPDELASQSQPEPPVEEKTVAVQQTPPQPPPPVAPPEPVSSASVAPPDAASAPVSPPAFAAQEVAIGNKDFPKPSYPYEAKRKRYEGTVLLALTVVEGRIVDVQVSGSSGYAILDTKAAQFIRQRWHFAPEVTRTLSQPITFQLADG